MLKGHFRRLHYLDTTKVSTAVDIIIACCILHDMYILEQDVLEEYMEPHLEPEVVNININDEDRIGINKRYAIARHLL